MLAVYVGTQSVVAQEADEAIGGLAALPSADAAGADADDHSYKVFATRRASTLERELNAAAAAGYRLEMLTWRVGRFLPLPGDRREMMAIVARNAQPARFSYRVVPARDEAESKIEARLNEAGEAGYRVREVGTSVILERDEAADRVAREFRVVSKRRSQRLTMTATDRSASSPRPR